LQEVFGTPPLLNTLVFTSVRENPFVQPDWSVVTIAGSTATPVFPDTELFSPNSPPGALTQIAEPAVE
jgi:hypothetical protein